MRDFECAAQMVSGGGVGGLGRMAQTSGFVNTGQLSAAPPPTPQGSLTDALSQLSNAITSNGALIGNTHESLERIGVLRPSYPTPDAGTQAMKAAAEPAQLAAALLSLVRMLESNNQRLADIFNRLDG